MEHLADSAMFLNVVDLGSFMAAPKALETSQRRVSKAIPRSSNASACTC